MTGEQLAKEIDALPDDAKRLVVELVSYLRRHSAAKPRRRKKAPKGFADDEFFGMWKDRTDMADPDYVRKLRRRERREPS